MNKDIQTLIEREAEKYTNGIYSNTEDIDCVSIIKDSCKKDYTQGFKDALSLFKWRKVWIEKPENKIRVNVKITSQREFVAHLIERNDKMFWVSSYDKREIECFDSDEWMPIPQID